MKKNVVVFFLVGLMSFGALAQEKRQGEKRGGQKPTPEKMAELKTKRIKESVGLNDEQYKKLYAINLDEAKKNQAKMEERRKAMMVEREAYKAKLKTVLSPEQLKKLEEGEAKKQYRGNNKKENGFKGKRAEGGKTR